ncbi:Ig-like domain-containing protein [Geobacillus stearothermophilus]|nr:Ig-like domain-containing protein [Geobacillus stearothermophilus]
MDKKKAVKLATASAVAASAFVAANPHASQAATDVATVVSQAKAQFKEAYYTYSHTVTETGQFPDINDVYAAYNKAKQAYANAVAVVNKAGGAKKDAYLADLQATYETYVFKANPKSGEARVATYIDAYNYATKLDAMRQELKVAVDAKDLKKAEELYHKISYELKTRTVILDRVYGQTTRELLRSTFKADAQALRDSLIYDITVAMKAREAQDAVKAGNLDKAKAALDQVNQYVSKVTDAFKAELQKAAQDANAAYEAALTPKVESVSANNLKVVTVKFNKEIDANTITANTVKVYVNSNTTPTTVDTTPSSVAAGQVGYILGEDKKTLSIVFGTALNQSDNVKVVVDGVKTTSQATVEKNETTLTLTDTTAPVAEKVEVVNNKKVKLYFNEPVNLDTAGIYKTTDVANAGVSLKVDGSLSFAKFTSVPEQNAVEVEFFNALADGSHTIEVADVKDFAGFKASAKSFTINTAADTKAPVATSIEYVSRTQIKVHFDEALKDAGGSTPTGTFEVYEAGNSTNLFSSASLSTDGKTVTINVNPAFTVAATVGLDVKYKNVEDIFGNKTTDFVTISGKAVDDAVKPTVSSVEVLDGNVLKVTFSEKVNAAGQTANFKLYKEDGTTVVASAAASVVNYDNTNPDGKTFKVTFNELSNVDSANYKLKVTGVQDTSIRQNTIDDVMLPFTAKDSKRPDLVTAVLKADASGNNDKIELVFSEAMDTTLLNNVANYFVGNGAANIPLNTISGAKVDSVSADGKKVTLLVPDADNSDTTGGLSAAVNRIAMPALKDTTGNYISNASIATPFTVAANYTAMTASDLKVEATGKNTIVVTALNGYYFTAADANAFKVERDGTDGTNLYDLGIVAAQLSADGKTITLTTSVPLTADAKYTDSGTPYAVDLFINGTAVKDQNGTPVTIADTASIDVQDKIKATQQTPVLKTGTTDVIVVPFDEAVAKATGITNDLLASAFEVKVGTTTLTPVVDYTATINSGKVELTITKAGVKNADVTVKLVKPEYLVDTNGNGVNALDVKTVSGVTEKVAPTVVTALGTGAAVTINNNASATVTFSEELDSASKTAVETAINTAASATLTYSWNGKVLTITNKTGSAVTFNADVTANITDLAGNTTNGAVVIDAN